MAGDRGAEAWLSWRLIPRLAASVASLPVVVGHASVSAALLVGHSFGEVLRGASWALDQIVGNTERTKAIGQGLRRDRQPAKHKAEERREATPGGQPPSAGLHTREDTSAHVGSVDAGRVTEALGDLSGTESCSETQWIVWRDAVCEAGRVPTVTVIVRD